jgi:hypothetical protein
MGMNWLRNKIREWLGLNKTDRVLRNNEKHNAEEIIRLVTKCDLIHQRLTNLEIKSVVMNKLLNEYFRVDAEVGCRGDSTIVLTGIYRGKGYVQFYDVGKEEFAHMVERMRDMHKVNLIRHVDAPYSCTGLFDFK